MSRIDGNYWFPKPYADAVARLRVPCGFVLLVAFALLTQPSIESIEIGLPIALMGLLFRAWATGHLAKNQSLATSGPYSYIRNPLYVGTLIVAAGIVIACRNWLLAAIFALVFLLVYLPVIELEEQHLRNIFPEYAAYAERTHRLLPLSRWNGPGARFSWALYLKNEEYQALLGFLLAAAWIIAKLCWRQTRG
ncbi:MAG: isoprenylcysteine carboxylmethyltransferase family protein [Bryobacteraceae bacterium]